jgi:hypothetical protein
MSRTVSLMVCALVVTALLGGSAGAVTPGGAAAGGREGAVGVSSPGQRPPTVPSARRQALSQDALAAALARDLSQRRFDVTDGYPTLYSEAECDTSFAVMGSCYGNNPAAPYILPVVRSWPEEYLDPATRGAFGATRDGYSATYRLDPREALVVVAELPPPARYLGFQSYLFTTDGAFDTTSDLYRFLAHRVPLLFRFLFTWSPGREGERVQSLSSLSNAINHVVMERRSGTVFGATRVFVVTPDQRMDAIVRRALRRLGVPDAHVFTEPIPSAEVPDGLGRLGLDEQANDYISVMRYAMPEDAAAGDAWREELPLSVVRVRERPTSRRPPAPYGSYELAPRTAVDELADPALGDGLGALVEAVCDRWDQPCDDTRVGRMTDLQGPPVNLVGPRCRSVAMNCQGDTQDTTYVNAPGMPLDGGEVYAVVGTLATETGNATYVGLSVNDLERLKGSANIGDDELRGSAATVADLLPDIDLDPYFVHYLTRDCAAIADLTDGHCTALPDELVPAGVPVAFALRSYVRPGTERGPDPSKLLPIRVIRLAP